MKVNHLGLTFATRPDNVGNAMKKPIRTKKIETETSEIQSLLNEIEVSDEQIFEQLIETDPTVCQNCGGDLDMGDHTYCSKF